MPTEEQKRKAADNSRRWRENHPEKAKLSWKKYYQNNKDKCKIIQKRKRNNPNSRWCELLKRAERYGHEISITREEWDELIKEPCYYCGKEARFGIDRVDNNLGYLQGNCVSCCEWCNRAKRNGTIETFYSQIKAIIMKHPWIVK